MGKKRVFAAIDIPDAVRDKICEHISRLVPLAIPGVRWVPPENFHITLKFAGSIDDDELSRLETRTAEIAGETTPFELQIEGCGAFVKKRSSSKVLWLGIRSNLPGSNIGGIIELLMGKLEDDGDHRRNPKPHLTIARLKDAEKARALIQAHLASNVGPHLFTVREIVIYESLLTPAGATYTPLSRHKLNG
jgi:RNA 2',3'-cyclic 3'-phosphodiesterase